VQGKWRTLGTIGKGKGSGDTAKGRGVHYSGCWGGFGINVITRCQNPIRAGSKGGNRKKVCTRKEVSSPEGGLV